jgi:predicted dehydrogenase
LTPNNKKFRVGIIGCGAVAELYYAPALKQMQDLGEVDVEVLCDPMKENLSRLAKSFPNAKMSEKFLEQSADLFIVASPPFLHAEQAVAVLRSGAAVLCEKPMGISASQCQEMIAAAQQSGRPLAIGLIRRFFPASQLIKQIITSQNLGTVQSFQFSEGAAFSWPARSSSFFDKRQAGGGVLLDLGSHVLDLLHWWLGEPKEVEYEGDAMGGVEVNCRLHLQYANGNHGTVRLSRDCQLKNECYMEFERGWIRWNLTDLSTIE